MKIDLLQATAIIKKTKLDNHLKMEETACKVKVREFVLD